MTLSPDRHERAREKWHREIRGDRGSSFPPGGRERVGLGREALALSRAGYRATVVPNDPQIGVVLHVLPACVNALLPAAASLCHWLFMRPRYG